MFQVGEVFDMQIDELIAVKVEINIAKSLKGALKCMKPRDRAEYLGFAITQYSATELGARTLQGYVERNDHVYVGYGTNPTGWLDQFLAMNAFVTTRDILAVFKMPQTRNNRNRVSKELERCHYIYDQRTRAWYRTGLSPGVSILALPTFTKPKESPLDEFQRALVVD
jgi:hypothetical protein